MRGLSMPDDLVNSPLLRVIRYEREARFRWWIVFPFHRVGPFFTRRRAMRFAGVSKAGADES